MSADKYSHIWPVEIRCNEERNQLRITFDNGDIFELCAELLRVESPSAEVQGHGASQKQTPKHKQNVTISELIPVGNYAVRIQFSDGHDTGIFSWALLHEYGRNAEQLMSDYRKRVAQDADS